MKYLAYFRPNEELCDLILRQNDVAIPGSGLHCTLSVLYMDPNRENDLVSNLSRINFNPFETETLCFDDFDKDTLVLKLSLFDELLQLHKNVVAVVRDHANDNFEAIEKRYCGNNYSPHYTIAKSSSLFNRNSRELIGQKNIVTRYTLAKKVDGSWQEIQTFYAPVAKKV